MKRMFFIVPILLISLLGFAEMTQPKIEMKEIKLISLPKNPQCTFYRDSTGVVTADPLLTAYHHGAERVFMGVINPHIKGFSGFSETKLDEKRIWTASVGKNFHFGTGSKRWTSKFFAHALKLELGEVSRAEEHVNYAGVMSVKHRFKSEKIAITGRCEA